MIRIIFSVFVLLASCSFAQTDNEVNDSKFVYLEFWQGVDGLRFNLDSIYSQKNNLNFLYDEYYNRRSILDYVLDNKKTFQQVIIKSATDTGYYYHIVYQAEKYIIARAESKITLPVLSVKPKKDDWIKSLAEFIDKANYVSITVIVNEIRPIRYVCQ